MCGFPYTKLKLKSRRGNDHELMSLGIWWNGTIYRISHMGFFKNEIACLFGWSNGLLEVKVTENESENEGKEEELDWNSF